MSGDRIEFDGRRAREVWGYERGQVSLSPADLWIYVEVISGLVRVYSGPPCRQCARRGTRWLRCKVHARCRMVAVQLDLI